MATRPERRRRQPAPAATQADPALLAAAAELTHFDQVLAGERAASPHTRSNYRRDVGQLLTLAAADGVPVAQLQARHIRGFVRQLRSRQYDARSIARALSAWRAFYRIMQRDRGWPGNPALGIRPPKRGQRLPQAFDKDAAQGLLNALPVETALDVRDRAMFELAYSSGLRVSEIVGLKRVDLDLQAGLARVLGKGNKIRQVPVGGAACRALQDWLTERPASLRHGEVAEVFVGRTGKPLTTRAVQLRCKHVARVVGLAEPFYPHKLRHSCATHLLQESHDLRAVQELLGHANLSTTQVYTHLDIDYLMKSYDQFHPRAKRQ